MFHLASSLFMFCWSTYYNEKPPFTSIFTIFIFWPFSFFIYSWERFGAYYVDKTNKDYSAKDYGFNKQLPK